MSDNTSETKILMAEALKRLIKERPFAKITVQDIVTECNINRNTFYYHFTDITELLSEIITSLSCSGYRPSIGTIYSISVNSS